MIFICVNKLVVTSNSLTLMLIVFLVSQALFCKYFVIKFKNKRVNPPVTWAAQNAVTMSEWSGYSVTIFFFHSGLENCTDADTLNIRQNKVTINLSFEFNSTILVLRSMSLSLIIIFWMIPSYWNNLMIEQDGWKRWSYNIRPK